MGVLHELRREAHCFSDRPANRRHNALSDRRPDEFGIVRGGIHRSPRQIGEAEKVALVAVVEELGEVHRGLPGPAEPLAVFIPGRHRIRIVQNQDDGRICLRTETGAERSAERGPRERHDHGDDEKRPDDQKEDLAELQPPDFGKLEFTQERQRAELYCL